MPGKLLVDDDIGACVAPKTEAGVEATDTDGFAVGVVVVEMLNVGLLFSLSTEVAFNLSNIP